MKGSCPAGGGMVSGLDILAPRDSYGGYILYICMYMGICVYICICVYIHTTHICMYMICVLRVGVVIAVHLSGVSRICWISPGQEICITRLILKLPPAIEECL
jgi:hypothetical protein